MLADTSDIHAFSVALRRHADDLGSVAAELSAARVAAEAFGAVGSGFVAALNDALIREAERTSQLADRVTAATELARTNAAAYRSADDQVAQSIPGA